MIVLPSPESVNYLLNETFNPFPKLPDEIRRVWIYETEHVNAIATTVRLDPRHIPLRLYQIVDPLNALKLKGLYRRLPPNQLEYTPSCLPRDYSQYCHRIWSKGTMPASIPEQM